ncbi:MAG: hypothetical protein ACOX8E_11165 [Ruminococcus sp.]|jgi:hypothetical protein
MVEVNIRIFFPKKETELFPDYHRHMDMLKEQLQGKVRVYLDETEDVPIYQYYSLSLFGCIETRYLRRMQIGKSVMHITEGILEYARNRHLPRIFKEVVYRYLKSYLNSFDYLVVTDKTLEQELKREGVCKPQFYEIPEESEMKREQRANLWLNFYERIEAA